MNQSAHYNLNLVEGTDLVNPLVQDVPNYETIDAAMFANANAGIQSATELKSGTVHAITRSNASAKVFKFVATSSWTAGDTMTVDGNQVSVLLPSGETLGTGAYVINASVICALEGTLVTAYVPSGQITEADNALHLDGHDADYFATAENLTAVSGVATAAGETAVSAKNNADLALSKVGNVGEAVTFSGITSKQIASGSIVSLGSVTFPADGTYLITGSVSFGANSTGYREIGYASDTTTLGDLIQRCAPSNGGNSNYCFARIVTGVANATRHIVARQNSGSQISCLLYGQNCIRIK